MGLIIFLLLPALGYASITIDITAAPTLNQSSAAAHGEDSGVVTNKELELFHITDSFLKKAAGKHSGGTPSDVFVKSPTPWGDLYKTYNWSEVKRETKVKRISIFSLYAIEEVLDVRQFTNNGSKDAVYESKIIAEDIENNVLKTFIGPKMDVGDMNYNISLIHKHYPAMNIKFESRFGNKETLIKKPTKLEARDVKVTVKPNQVVKVYVNATLVSLGVEVYYESSLSGHVAVNYDPKYKGHHFWAYDVKKLMDGVPLVWPGGDIINVKYYSNATVTAIDSQTGSTILSEDAQFADYSSVQF